MADKFTKLQPKDGEAILTCSHIDSPPFHWFKLPEPTQFTRPDKTQGMSQWIVLCQRCFDAHGTHPHTAVTGDGVWQGDAPTIRKDVQ